MLLVSKRVVAHVGDLAAELEKDAGVLAARTMPGFEASQEILTQQTHAEKDARDQAPSVEAGKEQSGGRFTPSAW